MPRPGEPASPVAGDALLDEIDDFVQELESEMQDAEAWQEEHGWSEYDDEDSLGPYGDFAESFAAFLNQAQAVFESGDLMLASKAYEKLFQAQDMENALSPNLTQLFSQALQNSIGYSPGTFSQIGPDASGARLMRAYEEQFARAVWSEAERTTFQAWCVNVTRQRVDAIVSGEHRQSYDKAALLVAAYSEAMQSENPKEANAIVDEVRQRFPRHSAFQSELRTALQRTLRRQDKTAKTQP